MGYTKKVFNFKNSNNDGILKVLHQISYEYVGHWLMFTVNENK